MLNISKTGPFRIFHGSLFCYTYHSYSWIFEHLIYSWIDSCTITVGWRSTENYIGRGVGKKQASVLWTLRARSYSCTPLRCVTSWVRKVERTLIRIKVVPSLHFPQEWLPSGTDEYRKNWAGLFLSLEIVYRKGWGIIDEGIVYAKPNLLWGRA